MIWFKIRKAYPEQWLVIEALEAHTTANNQRQLEKLAVIESCADGSIVMQLTLIDNLPFTQVTVVYQENIAQIDNVLVDTAVPTKRF